MNPYTENMVLVVATVGLLAILMVLAYIIHSSRKQPRCRICGGIVAYGSEYCSGECYKVFLTQFKRRM